MLIPKSVTKSCVIRKPPTDNDQLNDLVNSTLEDK